MRILGIETSCDDTGVAVVDSDRRILAQALYTQRDEHARFQGVVPEIAARAHLTRLQGLCRQTLAEAGLTLNDIDGFAATAGPGLIGGVMVGLMTGKTFAAITGKPFLGINHLEAHVLTPRLSFPELQFPFLVLLVSGGHTQIILARGYHDYEVLGATRDDAAGEAFDKTAKMLGLGYPGGPALEKLAKLSADPAAALARIALPVPMKGADHADFSFSGLKTAVRAYLDKQGGDGMIAQQAAADLAVNVQSAIAAALADRCDHALKTCKEHPNLGHPTALVVVGGVAANQAIRQALHDTAARHRLPLFAPPVALCTDNGVMIAWAGVEAMQHGQNDPLTLPARPRWPLAELEPPARVRA